ncbi:MAG: DUF1569 domain-containing protein [Bacteroidota bacterium]
MSFLPSHLFDEQIIGAVKSRILKLSPTSQPLWGRMHVAQMFAHCVLVMENAMGGVQQDRLWQGYLIAPFIRHRYYNDRPFQARNVPSTFKVASASVNAFATEQAQLINTLNKFYLEGRERCKGAIHPMLGTFTPLQWAIGQYKHLDHHLRQFGV